MPSPPTTDLPRPQSWDEFENIATDVLRVRWRDPNVTRNGRNGQKQYGVDVYGYPEHLSSRTGLAGAQCKRIDSLSVKVVDECVADAERFSPALSELIVCTTAPRDASVQLHARTLTQQRGVAGKFKVLIMFWEDLSLDLAGDRNLLAKHFPDWAALSVERIEPELTLGWSREGSIVDAPVLAAVPLRLTALAAVARPFDELELDDEGVSDEDREAAGRYNRIIEGLLADESSKERWFLQKRDERRQEFGFSIGLAVMNAKTTATEVLATVTFPKSFEIWLARERTPVIEASIALPERPRIGRARKLDEATRRMVSRLSPVSSALFAARHTFPRVLLAPPYVPGPNRRMDVDDNVVSLHVKKLPPRRQAHFDDEDEMIVVVPPPVAGIYEVQWQVDAENIKRPASGVWKITVHP